MVPTGTFNSTSPPSRPVLFEPSPWRPRSALCSGLKRKWTRVLWRSLDSMTMSPPLPPSPPEGPPRGTNFSRRKAMQPLPPSPAQTRILASSMNMEESLVARRRSFVSRRGSDLPTTSDQRLSTKTKASSRRRGCAARAPPPAMLWTFECLLDFHRLNHHELAHGALVQELDAPRDFGEEGIVFAAADVQPWLYARAPLPHDDGAAGHDLPAECLEAKPLRVRIAAVS